MARLRTGSIAVLGCGIRAVSVIANIICAPGGIWLGLPGARQSSKAILLSNVDRDPGFCAEDGTTGI